MSLETNKPAAEPASTGKPRRFRYSEAPVASAVKVASAPVGPLTATAALPANPITPNLWEPVWWALGAGAVVMIFLFRIELIQLIQRWASDAGWSHGFVVPGIAAYFIYLNADRLRNLKPVGSMWGLPVLLVGILGQVMFRATGLNHMSSLSILAVLFGVSLFVLGWDYLKILWLPIGYLAFALPPPTPLYVSVTTPMQMIAAELGAAMMYLVGGEGTRNGTTITVAMGGEPATLEVAQACAGMRMLVAFFALAVALAYSTDRPIWQKVTLAICALPIAIFCNGLRVMLTGVLVVAVDKDWAHGDAHGWFGLAMLVPALFLQLAVAWVLDRIFVEAPEEGVAA